MRWKNVLFRTRRRQGPVYYLALPVSGRVSLHALTGAARILLATMKLRAESLMGGGVEILGVHADARRMWEIAFGSGDGRVFFERHLTYVIMNPALLLMDAPPVKALLQQASPESISWCGSRVPPSVQALSFIYQSGNMDRIWEALGVLTSCSDGAASAGFSACLSASHLDHEESIRETSTAMAGNDKNMLPTQWKESQNGLNTAMGELLALSPPEAMNATDSKSLLEALFAYREISKVPWIFNSLANVLEHHLGRTKTQSIPAEFHLSTTGSCNIECRFCSYTHQDALTHFVNPEQIEQLDFLHCARVLRLQAGLGEPTLNRHLPRIIQKASERFPQLRINFFSNGILLGRMELVDAVLGRVEWINVSLNAGSRKKWADLCGSDQFDRVCESLHALKHAKKVNGQPYPVVYGSMVLTRANLQELPKMPELCRQLGIGRLTCIPFFALMYALPGKYDARQTLEGCRSLYDKLYHLTVKAAEEYQVSVELPSLVGEKQPRFGLEQRDFFNFGGIDTCERREQHLLGIPDLTRCSYLWRIASIGNRIRSSGSTDATHYLYPCPGPLCAMDLSRYIPFKFSTPSTFKGLWNSMLFQFLREAQKETGICSICDFCRGNDTRNPKAFPELKQMLSVFETELETFLTSRNEG